MQNSTDLRRLWPDVIADTATVFEERAAMPLETCFLCRVADHSHNLGLWLVHLDCWLAAFVRERLENGNAGER